MTEPDIQIDVTVDQTALAQAVPETADSQLLTATGIDSRPCEICTNPVSINERHAILRAGGEVWRHPWHTEPIG